MLQEYDDYHSARDAVERMDGKSLDGERLQVEPTSKCKYKRKMLIYQRDVEGEDLLLMTSAGHATNMVTGKHY